MKAVRLVTFVLVFVIAFSIWTPAPASAMQIVPGSAAGAAFSVEPAAAGMVKVTIGNKTGGTLFLSMVGLDNSLSYSFSAANAGKSTFLVAAGKYSYTISASSCPGSATRKRLFNGKTANLGVWFCRK